MKSILYVIWLCFILIGGYVYPKFNEPAHIYLIGFIIGSITQTFLNLAHDW